MSDPRQALETRRRVIALLERRDPAVKRHAAELFGTPSDPDFTPPDQRYVAPGHVLLEWVGGFSPFASPLVVALKANGYLTPIHQLVLKQIGLETRVRIDGRRSRTLTPRDGLSQAYRWGLKPGTYVQEVASADAERILASEDGHEFRIVGKRGTTDTTPVRDDAYWWRVMTEMSRRYDLPMPPNEAQYLRLAFGRAEALRGLDWANRLVWKAA